MGKASNSPDEDPRTEDELFLIIQEAEDDSDEQWYAMQTLRHRATRSIFERGRLLLSDPSERIRRAGVVILDQMGVTLESRNPFREEVIQLFHDMVHKEESERVLESLFIGLGYLDDPDILKYLRPYKNHPNDLIRFSIAFSLMCSNIEDEVDVLIELSQDEDPFIRDWATTGIACSDLDTPRVREALFARVDDEDWETRREAIEGLGERRDPGVIPYLVQMIAHDKPMSSTELCEALYALKDHYIGPKATLEQALRFCEEDNS